LGLVVVINPVKVHSYPSLESNREYSRVAKSLWDNPEFIQAGYHIEQYVTASVNTEAE
jgi:hypothetical protein